MSRFILISSHRIKFCILGSLPYSRDIHDSLKDSHLQEGRECSPQPLRACGLFTSQLPLRCAVRPRLEGMGGGNTWPQDHAGHLTQGAEEEKCLVPPSQAVLGD